MKVGTIIKSKETGITGKIINFSDEYILVEVVAVPEFYVGEYTVSRTKIISRRNDHWTKIWIEQS